MSLDLSSSLLHHGFSLPVLRLADALARWDALWDRTTVADVARRAAERYCRDGGGVQGSVAVHAGVFTTAAFQLIVHEEIDWTPTGDVVAELLGKEPGVERMEGEGYWRIVED